MDASRGTAGQRAGSRRTSSASSMEFASNTGTWFRTRRRKRNPGAVYPCSAAVSPSDEHHEVAHSTVAAAAVRTTPLAASAQSLTEAQARAVIAPWYSLFNQPVQGDMKTLQEQVLTADYESCSGYLPGECWVRDASIIVVLGFYKLILTMLITLKVSLFDG